VDPKEEFAKAARSLGLDACGACSAVFEDTLKRNLSETGPVPFAPPEIDRRLAPEELLPGARSFFVILFPYKTEDEGMANIALYARPKDYHRINHRYMEKMVEKMKALYPGDSFLPLTDTSPMVDRWLAYAAGLGFFGRNHCLINPTYGSYVTIGTILTTLSLAPDRPLSLSCGSCHACIGACPGRVLGGKTFNPWHCKSYLTQKKEDLTEEEEEILQRTPYIFGCDECQRCCPWNRRAKPSPLPEIRESRIPFLSQEALQSLSNRAFDRTYKEYAFAWRGKKVLLRNWEVMKKK
jgi:epoxyqueuosine reductase